MRERSDWNFAAASAYLDSLQQFGIKLGLEQTRELLMRCGNPQRSLRFLHLAGSNGKGSCGAMLESALRSAGVKTGFYTSPHLISVTERFRINAMALSEEQFTSYASIVWAAAEDMRHELGAMVTYFEFTTALALVAFAAENVEMVIWETGMGGRFDATNVVESDAAIITGIALEHCQYLGNTLAEIAQEKAGIIKPGRPVFSGCLPEEAEKVIRERASELGCKLYGPAGEVTDVKVFRNARGKFCQSFLCDGEQITLALSGPMQRQNFRTVWPVLKYLEELLHLDHQKLLNGLTRTKWPGRCQEIEPGLWLDGGHNPDGLRALRATLEELFPGEKFDFIFGAFADKAVEEALEELLPVIRKITFVPVGNEFRPSADPEKLCIWAQKHQVSADRDVDVATAVAKIPEEGVIHVVAGSLYMAGELLDNKLCRESILNLQEDCHG